MSDVGLGFRADKDAIYWAAVTLGDSPVLESHGTIKAPGTYTSDAQVFSYFRQKVKEKITQYDAKAAGVKYSESGRRASHIASGDSRCRVEGVIVEAIHSQGLEALTGGHRKAGAGMKAKSSKKYVQPDTKEVRGVKFAKQDVKHKEAVTVAVAALEEFLGSPDVG